MAQSAVTPEQATAMTVKGRQLGKTRTATYIATGIDIDGEWPRLTDDELAQVQEALCAD